MQTPCGNRATLAAGTPLTTPTVILDAGHGGGETGAVGPNRLRESVVNLAVSIQARNALKAAGVNVLLTRPGDDRVVLASRSQLVDKLKPAVFVSVHHNSDPDGPRDTPGTETYYQYRSAPSKRLAGLVYEEVLKTLSTYQVAWVGDTDAGAKYRLNDRGGDYYHVLRETAGVPSVIAELAFISNGPEADLLARPDVQQAEGQAVARGILRWLRTKDPGSGYVTPYPAPRRPSAGAARDASTRHSERPYVRSRPRDLTLEESLVLPKIASRTMPMMPRADRPTLIHAMTVAARARPSPPSQPPDAAILLLAFEARMRAAMAGRSGQTVNDTMARMRAAMAWPSVFWP